MIQFDKDGVTLYYIDADGKKTSHYFMEGTAYADMLDVRSAQLQAVAENALSVANYNTALANAQLNIGRPGFVLPTKPVQKVVSDTGGVSYTPFVPPLPDIVMPHVDPSTVSGLVNTAVPPTPDKQAIMYNMILAMFRRMFPDA